MYECGSSRNLGVCVRYRPNAIHLHPWPTVPHQACAEGRAAVPARRPSPGFCARGRGWARSLGFFACGRWLSGSHVCAPLAPRRGAARRTREAWIHIRGISGYTDIGDAAGCGRLTRVGVCGSQMSEAKQDGGLAAHGPFHPSLVETKADHRGLCPVCRQIARTLTTIAPVRPPWRTRRRGGDLVGREVMVPLCPRGRCCTP